MIQNNRFNGEVIIIFGGTQGIGRKITESFAEEGALVVITDIDREGSEIFVRELREKNLKAVSYYADICCEQDIKRVVEDVINKYHKIDVLVNNVRGKRNKAENPLAYSFREWMNEFNYILGGTYLTCKYIVPEMIKLQKGVVLNTASISGMLVGEESPHYHAAKAGLIQFTKYLADKYGQFNIRANCISPGFIVKEENLASFNDISNKSYREMTLLSHPLRKIGSCQDVARAALFLCSEESSFITGENIIIDGGLSNRDQWSVANQIRQSSEKSA